MGKIYLVDSENVGDIWVPLLVSSQEDDEVLVFYTQGDGKGSRLY